MAKPQEISRQKSNPNTEIIVDEWIVEFEITIKATLSEQQVKEGQIEKFPNDVYFTFTTFLHEIDQQTEPVSKWKDGCWKWTITKAIDESFIRQLCDERSLKIRIAHQSTANESDEWHFAKIQTLRLHWCGLLVGDMKSDADASIDKMLGDNLSLWNAQIKINRPLLSPLLQLKLKPIEITMESVNQLPMTLSSYEQMDEKYKKVWLQYKWIVGESDGDERMMIKTRKHRHSENIIFDAKRCILSGMGNFNALLNRLAIQPLEIELHDRDWNASPIVDGETTTATPPQDLCKELEETATFGVARVSLEDLCYGLKSMEIFADFLPHYGNTSTTTHKELPSQSSSNVLFDMKSSVNPPCAERINPYNTSKPYVTVRIRTSIPLGRPLPDDILNMYRRALFIFKYDDDSIYLNLIDTICSVNAKALGIPTSNYQVVARIELNQQQRSMSSNIDYVSGWHVVDGEYRMIALEGRCDGRSLDMVIQAVPRSSSNDHNHSFLYCSNVTFEKREYDDFHATPRIFKLRKTLRDIANEEGIHLKRSSVPNDCYSAFDKLVELRRCTRMHMAKRMNLFPSPIELKALEQKYGDFVSDVDAEGGRANLKNQRPMPPEWHPYTQKLIQNTLPQIQFRQYATYELKTRMKVDDEVNHKVDDKVDASICKTERNHSRTRDMPLPPWGVVYLYSGQKLNYKVWYLEHLRKTLEKEHPNSLFVYSKDYLNQTLPQPTLEYRERIEKKLNHQRFLTKEGFSTVKARSPAEFVRRTDRPSEARIADLHIPYEDRNLSLGRYKAKSKQSDGRPAFDAVPARSAEFGYCGKQSIQLRNEDYSKSFIIEREEQRMAEWRAKLRVDNENMRFYKRFRSNQKHMDAIDIVEPILKDKPKKHGIAFRKANLKVKPPPFSIMSSGVYEESQTRKILLRTSHPDKFAGGRDFKLRSKANLLSKPNVYTRKIQPLPEHAFSGTVWDTTLKDI